MIGYITRRLLYAAFTFVLITGMVFSAVRLLPGDVLMAAFDESGFTASPEQRQAIREDLGLDKPVPVQYVMWAGKALRGDLGHSFISGQPVSRLLRQAVPITLELSLLALSLALIVGLPLGILGALQRGNPIDYLSRLIAVLGLTVPSFVLAMVALLVGVRWFSWVPPTRYTPILDNPRDNLGQFVIPSIILGFALASSLARMTRSAVLEVMLADYVRTAHAKGLGGRLVLTRHILRNALIPVITVLGLQFASMIGGAIVVESIFNLPGMGQLLLNGVLRRDFPVVQAAVVVAGMGILLINVLVDISYSIIDPRVKYD